MKIAIIGCGLIGEKRAKALGDNELVAAADMDIARARKLCGLRRQGRPVTRWEEALDSDAELVIVATTNDWLAPIGMAALAKNKHVLVEKPCARSVKELLPFAEAARKSSRKVKAGFNHRYHPAFKKMREIVDSGVLGELMFIRARYGHGGRVGYEKEWRADPKVSGGGELIDQGVHVIDLSRWFLGDFTHVEGFAHTYFWKMCVDDNAFVGLRTEKKQVAWLHVSCTEWKNMFSFELYGRTGKLQVDGLGGSYGTERLSFYRMLPHMGPPETTIWEYPGADNSWKDELDDFIACIEQDRPVNGTLDDALKSLELVEKVYTE